VDCVVLAVVYSSYARGCDIFYKIFLSAFNRRFTLVFYPLGRKPCGLFLVIYGTFRHLECDNVTPGTLSPAIAVRIPASFEIFFDVLLDFVIEEVLLFDNSYPYV